MRPKGKKCPAKGFDTPNTYYQYGKQQHLFINYTYFGAIVTFRAV